MLQRMSREESKTLTKISKLSHTISSAKDLWKAEKLLMELEEAGHFMGDDREDAESLCSERSDDLVSKYTITSEG